MTKHRVTIEVEVDSDEFTTAQVAEAIETQLTDAMLFHFDENGEWTEIPVTGITAKTSK